MSWLTWLLTPTNGLPFLLSLWTMLCMWVVGHNPRRGWMLALIGQGLWLAYTFAADAWGFLPLNVGLTVIYARNLSRARVMKRVPAHPALDVLQDLFTLKQLKDSIERNRNLGCTSVTDLICDREYYEKRYMEVWAKARALVYVGKAE